MHGCAWACVPPVPVLPYSIAQRARPRASQHVLNQSQEPAAHPIFYQIIFTCGSEYNLSYSPQPISPRPSHRAKEQADHEADPQNRLEAITSRARACQSRAKARTEPQRAKPEPRASSSNLLSNNLSCGSEYNLSYPPQPISPRPSQRAKEQATARTPRKERVGEYSDKNTPSSPPHPQ